MIGLFIFVIIVALLSGVPRWLGAPRFVALVIPIFPLVIWLSHGLATGEAYVENGKSLKIWEDALIFIAMGLPVSTVVAFIVPNRGRASKGTANTWGGFPKDEIFNLKKEYLQASAEPSPARKIATRFWCVFLGTIVLTFIWMVDSVDRIRERANPMHTYVSMVFLAQECERYKSSFGNWPASMTDLSDSMSGGGTAKDTWGNDIVFVPFDSKLGYGQFISYGRDGVPGGTGTDRDWIIRFPIKPNYAWDKKEWTDAIAFTGMTNYNWFDGRVSGESQ